MPEFTMPSLGADMDEGTLTEWLVKPGDEVHHGDIVAVVETDKSTIEVECFAEGTVERLLVEPGATVPVGTPLAIINVGGAPEIATSKEPIPHETGVPTTSAMAMAATAKSTPGFAPKVSSPLVRHLAQEKGVDLTNVSGTAGQAESPVRTSNEPHVRGSGCAPRRSPAGSDASSASTFVKWPVPERTASSGPRMYATRRRCGRR